MKMEKSSLIFSTKFLKQPLIINYTFQNNPTKHLSNTIFKISTKIQIKKQNFLMIFPPIKRNLSYKTCKRKYKFCKKRMRICCYRYRKKIRNMMTFAIGLMKILMITIYFSRITRIYNNNIRNTKELVKGVIKTISTIRTNMMRNKNITIKAILISKVNKVSTIIKNILKKWTLSLRSGVKEEKYCAHNGTLLNMV